MVYEALSCLANEMNEHFRNRLRINEQKVVISSIVNQDGTIAIQGENKLVITLINTEKESAVNKPSKGIGSFSNASTTLNLNLYLLFSAYFSQGNYLESLRFLSFVIGYFVNKPVFSHANTPDLDNNIEKLSFEIVDMNTDTLSNLWSTLGAKYMPSVVYKVRMITFNDTYIKEFRPTVSGIFDDKLLKKE